MILQLAVHLMHREVSHNALGSYHNFVNGAEHIGQALFASGQFLHEGRSVSGEFRVPSGMPNRTQPVQVEMDGVQSNAVSLAIGSD